MANIQISESLVTGYELFNDSASFLNELANQEIETIVGGGSCHKHHYNHSHHNHHSHKDYSHKEYSNDYSDGGWW
jgi:hypothetical protein